MDKVRMFIASDQRNAKAEKALEYSIRKHGTEPVEITWMRAGDPGWMGGTEAEFRAGKVEWNLGRPANKPWGSAGGGCATEFTRFRMILPCKAGYAGRAIYLDPDMLVLGDIRQLWEQPMDGKALMAISSKRFDVLLFDCGHNFWTNPAWPKQDKIRGDYIHGAPLRDIIIRNGQVGWLTQDWDCLDGAGYEEGKTKLVHYTNMNTQPWRPWEGVIPYTPHRDPRMVKLWWDTFKEAEAQEKA
jgi:hypothetical protein